MFNTISIEISSLCNRQCAWCPVAYNTRPDERMQPDILYKIVNQLTDLRYAGRVELYIYNEPTKDMAYLLDVIRIVRRLVPRACIMIATNGDYLRGTANIMRLYDAGLNQLLINSYTKGLQDRRRKWVDALPADVERDGPIYSYVSPKRKVVKMEDKHDPNHFGDGVFALTNRAGNIPDFRPAVLNLPRMCVRPFRVLNINWQGEALICCQDYHGAVKVGNVRDHTLMEIWNGPVFTKYRQHLYQKKRDLPLCETCDCHSGAYPANVPDPFADEV